MQTLSPSFKLALMLALNPVVDPDSVHTPRRRKQFTALLALLSTGVVRAWRWTFWLILGVFFADILRVPASVMQLAREIPAQGPPWYVVLQAVVGYRKAGIWGCATLCDLRLAQSAVQHPEPE